MFTDQPQVLVDCVIRHEGGRMFWREHFLLNHDVWIALFHRLISPGSCGDRRIAHILFYSPVTPQFDSYYPEFSSSWPQNQSRYYVTVRRTGNPWVYTTKERTRRWQSDVSAQTFSGRHRHLLDELTGPLCVHGKYTRWNAVLNDDVEKLWSHCILLWRLHKQRLWCLDSRNHYDLGFLTVRIFFIRTPNWWITRYFHGDISKEEVSTLLQRYEVGTYLVRLSCTTLGLFP